MNLLKQVGALCKETCFVSVIVHRKCVLGDVSIQEAVDQSELLPDNYSSHLLQKLLVTAEDKV